MSLGRTLLVQVGLTATYSVAGRLSLLLAFAHPSASPAWAPSGIALAAGLVLGARAWPAVFVGAFLVNVTTAGTVLTSLGIASGNTLEAVIATYLVTRFANGRNAFTEAKTAFAFVILAGCVSTTVAATVGVASLTLGGVATVAEWWTVWITWWLGDAAGILMVAPAILLWMAPARTGWSLGRALEAAAIGIALFVTGFVAFAGLSPHSGYQLKYLALPILMWAAFRFGPREAITAVIAMAGIAIQSAVGGYGPFTASTPNSSLLSLQAYLTVIAATTLVIAASIARRHFVEQQLREWSITDPLTGLGNYRQLTVALDRELQRMQRTERSFALILLDLDQLKQINDHHGHRVGSRALCRVAEVVGRAGRTVDTAARYGGDEFAIVLPESGEEEAQKLAERITAQLARDSEQPPISVSIGVAVAPRDGDTVETLIDAADRLMYGAKRRRSGDIARAANPPLSDRQGTGPAEPHREY